MWPFPRKPKSINPGPINEDWRVGDLAECSAKRAWNKDGGPIEKTIKAGEDLYFAASFLIEALIEGRP